MWLTPAEVRAEVSALKRARAFTNADLARAVLGDAFTQSRYQLVGKFLNTGGEFGGANQDVYAPMARFVEKCRGARKAKVEETARVGGGDAAGAPGASSSRTGPHTTPFAW